MKVTINKDTAFYVIPTKDLLRICINNDCFEKNMTIDGYFNLITNGSNQTPLYFLTQNDYTKIEEVFSVFEKKILEMDEALEEDYETTSVIPNFFENYKVTKIKIEKLMEEWAELEEKLENCS